MQQCTVPTMQHHSTVEYPELSFLFIFLPQYYTYVFKIYRAHLVELNWRPQVFIYFVVDENVWEQIPHCVNVANVFFTCMRFLRIAYPNLLLEMCVHGGMLAHFSTYNVSFFTTLSLIGMREGTFIPLSCLDLTLSAEFLSKLTLIRLIWDPAKLIESYK